MHAFLRIASGATGIMLSFDSTADDWINFDRAANDYVPTGRRDSFLSMTGYKSRFLAFEFFRRLAWCLGKDSGVFQGCVLHLTAQSSGCSGYDDTNLVKTVPQAGQVEQSWTRTDDDTTIYFPRSINDMCSIVNEDWHDAIIYFGLSKSLGFIERLEEDDERLIMCEPTRAIPVVIALAESMGLPVQQDGRFDKNVAFTFSSYVPEITVRQERVYVKRSGRS